MEKINETILESSSFRDPSGFVFSKKGDIYRQINNVYKSNYDLLINSGLYKFLVDRKLLIPHYEVTVEPPDPQNCYKTIKPEEIKFISYPYEWSFSQLKDAALTTLEIQKKAMEFGLTLKDASAFNIQFKDGKPLLIDTLSFEKLEKGKPWAAYRQFCQHFLAPLALMAYKDLQLNKLFTVFLDGIPLQVASSLLPLKTIFNFPLLIHLHVHAKIQYKYADKTLQEYKEKEIRKTSLLGIIESLELAIKKLNLKPKDTAWTNYYEDTNYSTEAFNQKKQVISDFLDDIKPKLVWDLGANVGLFSREVSKKNIYTVAIDSDPACVEKNYLICLDKKETNVLPLHIDLTNPSPDIGWQNNERLSLLKRGPADAVIALALIHHLAISNNLPFAKIADFFNQIGNNLIIEYVPKSDSQVQRIISGREEIFPNYSREKFEQEFMKYYQIIKVVQLINSERILYLMKRK